MDGKILANQTIPTNGDSVVVNLSLDSGLHVIEFITDGCDKPSEIEGSNDERYLSIRVTDLRIDPFEKR